MAPVWRARRANLGMRTWLLELMRCEMCVFMNRKIHREMAYSCVSSVRCSGCVVSKIPWSLGRDDFATKLLEFPTLPHALLQTIITQHAQRQSDVM